MTKTQYKQTSIGLIPTDWEVKSLGELGEFKSGSGFPIDEQGGSNGIPFYKVSDMNLPENEIFMNISNNYISEEQVLKLKLKPINKEAIIFAKVGAAIFLERKRLAKCFLIDNNMMALVPKIPSFFLKYYLDFIRLSKYAQTGALPAYNASDLKIIQIPIPPLPEQNKIAEILSTWDKAIQDVQLLIKKLELRNKALAFSLLTGKKRVKGFEEKWEITNFGKIISRVTTKNEELDDTVVTISAKRGFILQEDFFNKRVASDTLSGYYLLKKGQFAYNKSYSNGYPMGVFKRLNDFDKAVVTTLYICFELKENICSDFMVHYFDNGLMNTNLMKIAKEGGRAHGLLNIGIEDFMNLKITMPSLEEQTAIAEILNTAHQELKRYQEKLKVLQQQKKGLMQQLLTGKIRTV